MSIRLHGNEEITSVFLHSAGEESRGVTFTTPEQQSTIFPKIKHAPNISATRSNLHTQEPQLTRSRTQFGLVYLVSGTCAPLLYGKGHRHPLGGGCVVHPVPEATPTIQHAA